MKKDDTIYLYRVSECENSIFAETEGLPSSKAKDRDIGGFIVAKTEFSHSATLS